MLAWFENYTEDELPNENLWDDAEYIEHHFAAVRRRREARFKPGGDAGGDQDAEMMGNDLADSFKG